MLKFFYRLRRRGGVVLFAVIAIMTLLIAMATAAYFTARSSYKNVVSNYDNSQLYLASSALTDMVVEAITQDTSHEKDASGNTINDYKSLKNRIATLETSVISGGESGFTAKSFVVRSKSIKGVDKSNMENFYNAASSDPLINGIIDGAEITVTIDNYKKKSDEEHTFYYTISTVGYYRKNVVIISESFIHERSKGKEKGPDYNTFLTATAQTLGGDDGAQKIHSPDRAVIVDIDEINDNAYFQTGATCFGYISGRSNKFLGGIRTSGDLYMYNKIECDIPGPTSSDRHDWIVGGNMYVGGNCAVNLNGNDLYVNGDLILNKSGQCINGVNNVFVNGNIYILDGESNLQANKIYTKNGTGSIIASGTKFIETSVYGTLAMNEALITNRLHDANPYTSFSFGFNEWTYTQNPNKVATGNMVSYSPTDEKYKTQYISTTVKNETDHTYDHKLDGPFTPSEVFETGVKVKTEGGEPDYTTFPLYTGNSDTFANNVTIDFEHPSSKTTVIEGEGESATVVGYTFTFEQGITAYLDGDYAGSEFNGHITVDIPYNEKGYNLYIPDNSYLRRSSGTGTTWHIGTKAGTQMPIILQSNCNYNGKKGFSWCGNKYGTDASGQGSDIILVTHDVDADGKFQMDEANHIPKFKQAEGAVAFEMANYDSSTGAQVRYNKTGYIDGNKIATTVYCTAQQEFLGTLDQFDKVGHDYKNSSNMYVSGTHKPNQDDSGKNYLDKVLLISNALNDIAFDCHRDNNMFCGYLYAPNGTYVGGPQTQEPVFGGMIISDYCLDKTKFMYAEPDPTLIDDLFSSMEKIGSSAVSVNKWITVFNDTTGDLGRNFLG